ncbi:hypothetical protein KCU81_g10115, partial [Aureobasidium melanogenum]|uniref:Uncharacterized protein n=2 Tax=Aureobasidium melanogenum TaxID=46634 RepID=A0A074VA02_AURM1
MSDLPDHMHEGRLLSRAFACQNQLMEDSLGQTTPWVVELAPDKRILSVSESDDDLVFAISDALPSEKLRLFD